MVEKMTDKITLYDIKDFEPQEYVKVVRCKNCKYSSYEPHKEYKNVYICNRTVWTRMNGGNTADDYCSYGRMKEE